MATSKFGRGRDDAADGHLSPIQVWLICILIALTLELITQFPVSSLGSEVCGRLAGTIWAWNSTNVRDPSATGQFGSISGPDHGTGPDTSPAPPMTRSFG